MTHPFFSAALQAAPPPPKPPPASRWLGLLRKPKFDKLDWALLGASTAALAGDWLTTIDGVRRRQEGWREYNPILGASPSVGQVNTYTGAVAVGNALIASQLSPNWRKAWLAGTTAIELATLLGNKKAGLRFNFSF